MPSDEHPTSIRIPRSLKAQLQQYAKAQSRSMSWLVVDIIRQWVEWVKAEEGRK